MPAKGKHSHLEVFPARVRGSVNQLVCVPSPAERCVPAGTELMLALPQPRPCPSSAAFPELPGAETRCRFVFFCL